MPANRRDARPWARSWSAASAEVAERSVAAENVPETPPRPAWHAADDLGDQQQATAPAPPAADYEMIQPAGYHRPPGAEGAASQALARQAGDRLKLIANYGAGIDHIDVATARQRGILVSNTPGVVTDDTADMTMALILASKES